MVGHQALNLGILVRIQVPELWAECASYCILITSYPKELYSNLLTRMAKMKKISLAYLVKNISIAIGLVLIWRGIWYVLDKLDALVFGGSHVWTALGGIALGLFILYLPDHDLKEIEKL